VQWDFGNGKLTMVLSSKCNLACSMCSIIRSSNQGQLTREQAFDVGGFGLDSRFKMIEVTGGEPFLLPYIYDLLGYLCHAAGENTTIFLTTNGTAFNSGTIRFLSSLPHLHCQLSIDGLEDAHNEVRGRSYAFRKTAEAVEELHSAGIALSLNTVVQRANFHQMMELFERFRHIDYLYHAFCLYEPDSANLEAISISAEQAGVLREQLECVQSAAARSNKPVVIAENIIERFVARTLGETKSRLHPGLGCTVPLRSVIVEHTGNVFPCWHYSWPVERIGSINDRSLGQIIEGAVYRAAVMHGVSGSGCRGCDTLCYNWDADFRRKVMTPGFSDLLLAEIQSGMLQSQGRSFLGKGLLTLKRKGVVRAVGKSLERFPKTHGWLNRIALSLMYRGK
jgi:AdoMet-dependent heme synthase